MLAVLVEVVEGHVEVEEVSDAFEVIVGFVVLAAIDVVCIVVPCFVLKDLVPTVVVTKTLMEK